jgi:hypothetical protein
MIVVCGSSVIQTVESDKKKIAKSGGGSVLYLSNLAKQYLNEGDLVDYQVILDGNLVRIIATKRLYAFALEDIKKLVKPHEFKIEYDKTLGDIQMFTTIRDHISLSYTKNIDGKIHPANIALSMTLQKIDYDAYLKLMKKSIDLKAKYNLITRFEGDLDAITLLKEPDLYKVDTKEIFELFKKDNKKIGLSIVIRFDDMKNNLEDVSNALNDLMGLDR